MRALLVASRPSPVSQLVLRRAPLAAPRSLIRALARRRDASERSNPMRLTSKVPRRRGFSSCCLGIVLNAADGASFSWVPLVNQILLVTAIVFAYMAGVVPNGGNYMRTRKDAIENPSSDGGADFLGRHADKKSSTDAGSSWVQLEQKLTGALGIASDENELKWDGSKRNCPSSLLALRGGSRLRLLVATLQRLHKEVFNISQVHEVASHDTRVVISSNAIKASIQPIFLDWLEGELFLQKKMHEKEFLYEAFGKLDADGSILRKIILSAKANLYGDFLFHLRFGSHGSWYYDKCVFEQHEIEILEDLVISLADGISSNYLELISLDSSLSPEGNYLGSSLCSLSTRELQKLRNQVALDQWLIQNFESVVSMYEDRFDLFVLKRMPLEEPDVDATGKFSFLKTSLFQRQSSKSYSNCVVFTQFSIFVRRTKELKALAGWKYYYSLFLELSDIAMPLIRAAFVKARNAVSFFLTCLIGRSLGLIYSGIRQSLGWR